MDETIEVRWVEKKPDTWVCLDKGRWGDKRSALFDQHDTRSGGLGKVEFFVPDAIIVEGPASLNPSETAFRLYLSREGIWRGPFASLAAAKHSFEQGDADAG